MKKLLLILVCLFMVGCSDTKTETSNEPNQPEVIPQEEFKEEGDWEAINNHVKDPSYIQYYFHWYNRSGCAADVYLDVTNTCSKHSFKNVVMLYDMITPIGLKTGSVTINLEPNGKVSNAYILRSNCVINRINNVRIQSWE